MKRIVKWLLSAVIGAAVSFVILLLSESLHQLVTCAIAAYFVFGILNYVVLEKSDMRLLASIAAFIIVFLLYFSLYSHVNEECEMNDILPYVVFFAPYVLMSYLLFGNAPRPEAANDENVSKNKPNQ